MLTILIWLPVSIVNKLLAYDDRQNTYEMDISRRKFPDKVAAISYSCRRSVFPQE